MHADGNSAGGNSPIVSLKTGVAFGGGRFGVLRAADHAAPGSLLLLTEFLREKGFQPLPGYGGNEKHPVLRIAHFENDAVLMKALHQEFPRWQEARGIAETERLVLPPSLTPAALPVDTSYKAVETIGSYVDQHRNLLPALSYVAGDLALLFSARHYGGGKDGLRTAAAGAYGLAAGNLLVFGGKADVPRNTRAILAAVEPELDDPKHQRGLERAAEQTARFLMHHPWEISGILNMAGLGVHGASALRRGTAAGYIEAAGVAASFTGMMLQSFLPEHGGEPIIDLGRVMGGKRRDYPPLTPEMLDHPTIKAQGMLASFLDNPVRASGHLSSLSNAGWAISAMLGPKVDWGLLATSGLYLNGNLLQLRAQKDYMPSFDDFTSAAAARLIADGRPDEARIGRMAEALSLKPEVRASEGMLRSALRHRIDARLGDTASEKTGGLLVNEQEFIDRSPFLPAHLARAAASSPEHAR